jgi:putative acetyltransferase
VEIRPATAADWANIRDVHLRAFPTAAEAKLVERLIADGDAAVSIVADSCRAIVGHVLMSRMNVHADGRALAALGLAPVAVVPDRQRQKIGSALVEAAVREASSAGAEILFVLGEPDYYGRFGFSAETAAPFASPYAGRHFQALALAGLTPIRSGAAGYAPAFADLG